MGNEVLWRDEPLVTSPNPMTRVFGLGEGVSVVRSTTSPFVILEYRGPQCGSCLYLTQRDSRFKKCEKRGITNGAGTDHRVSWPACGLYVADPDVKRDGVRSRGRG